jgi:predicted AAA+ superfamily ATPase
MHSLLQLSSRRDLDAHPKVGASWEGFIIGEILRALRVSDGQAFFWATYGGAELDLLIVRNRERIGFEIKRTDTPSITPSMRSALADLRLTRLHVVHAGRQSFDLARKVHATAASDLLNVLER